MTERGKPRRLTINARYRFHSSSFSLSNIHKRPSQKTMLSRSISCRRTPLLRRATRLPLTPLQHHVTRRHESTTAAVAIEEDIHRIPPQLDYKRLVENAEVIKRNMQLRKYDHDHVDKVCALYGEREQLEREQEQVVQERDATNRLIREAKSKEERQTHIAQGKKYKEQLKKIAERLAMVEEDLCTNALLVPNDTHPDVPVGSEDKAKLIKMVGTPVNKPHDHLTVAERLGMVDFAQASKVSGSKFYYLTQGGAWLEMALIQFAMHKATERGFSPVITPDIVRTSVAYGCGFQPRKSEASQIYDVSTASTVNTTAPKLCLTGTAEIPLAGLFAQKMLKEEELPQRVVGFGRAFRAEAGHGSAEERGLYRVHQFSKVELFAVTTPQQSNDVLEELRSLQEDIFTDLGLCFR